MNINGKNTLACLCRIPKDNAEVKVYPLPHSELFYSPFSVHDLIFHLKCTSSRFVLVNPAL